MNTKRFIVPLTSALIIIAVGANPLFLIPIALIALLTYQEERKKNDNH